MRATDARGTASRALPGDDIGFSDGGLADAAGSWGIAVAKGSITVATEYRHHNRTNRASFDARDQIVTGDGGNDDVAQPNHRWGDPDARDLMTFVDASIPLDASQTHFLYAFGGYRQRTANSAGFFRRALDARTWPQIHPGGFLPVIEPTVLDASAAVGVQGARGRWTYDVSGRYGRNSCFCRCRLTQRVARTGVHQDDVRRRHSLPGSVRRQRRRQPHAACERIYARVGRVF